jgi:hypothetical protein
MEQLVKMACSDFAQAAYNQGFAAGAAQGALISGAVIIGIVVVLNAAKRAYKNRNSRDE